MRTLYKTALATVALSLALAGCGKTEAQKEVDKQADAIDKSYEAQADVVEALGTNAPDEEAAKQKADALRDKGEAIKDDLKDQAKHLDDAPKK
ncbi:MAG: hypothetical protein P0Y56_04740 [Candidatus Andeanibacterium colombiense]|uniref:Lipoprotein n=1 Tax=Candidatus Andeanibacterium colombiense TaxID=3121345 RepID=A0AAJ6BNQ1_9SPHN|nr:MAG: hypothetical protein P0Y56_04740 [Sphingomonadaceae bacterium]